MGSLGRKLKRELKKSPAKAAVLGLVCLIALWYWAPILKNSLTGASEMPPDIVVVNSKVPDASDLGMLATAKANVGKAFARVCKWQTLVKRLDEDPRVKPATLSEEHRNPFRRFGTGLVEDLIELIEEEDEVEEVEEEPTELVAAPETPEREEPDLSDLKLVLGGTIVGSRYRSASINGNTYQEGDVIEYPVGGDFGNRDDSNVQTIELELAAVNSSHVVLKRQGAEYRLQLERARLALGDRIQRCVAIDKMDAVNERKN